MQGFACFNTSRRGLKRRFETPVSRDFRASTVARNVTYPETKTPKALLSTLSVASGSAPADDADQSGSSSKALNLLTVAQSKHVVRKICLFMVTSILGESHSRQKTCERSYRRSA